jgi:hypothetical protein
MYLKLAIMKKIYLTMTLLGIAISPIFGQVCSPDNSITKSGVYPDQPDTAYADQAYDFSFQILSIKDTAVIVSGQNVTADIDSVKVDAVIGLPNNFEYACNPSQCTFTHKAVGCINLKGNPTPDQVGVYDIKIATTAYASASFGIGPPLKLPVADTTEGYKLVIKGNGSASIYENAIENSVNVYPNPSSNGIFMLHANTPITSIEVFDTRARKVNFSRHHTNNTIVLNLSDTPQGIYFLKMDVDNKQVVKSIVH